MLKIYQTKFNNPETDTAGNCLAAVIASILEKSIDEVPQDTYLSQRILDLIWKCGFKIDIIYEEKDIPKDEFYIAIGKSPRNPAINHAVIFQNGELYHDPFGEANDSLGILTEEYFLWIQKRQK
jgi:hypothetical protein